MTHLSCGLAGEERTVEKCRTRLAVETRCQIYAVVGGMAATVVSEKALVDILHN